MEKKAIVELYQAPQSHESTKTTETPDISKRTYSKLYHKIAKGLVIYTLDKIGMFHGIVITCRISQQRIQLVT